MENKSQWDGYKVTVMENFEETEVPLKSFCNHMLVQNMCEIYEKVGLCEKQTTPEELDRLVDCYLDVHTKYLRRLLHMMFESKEEQPKPKEKKSGNGGTN